MLRRLAVIAALTCPAFPCVPAPLASPPRAAPSRGPEAALRMLDGTWTGDGLSLTFNARTLQANDDPDKPFSWRPFHLVNASGSWLIFDIAGERYFGLLRGEDAMTVTSSRFPGERSLRRRS